MGHVKNHAGAFIGLFSLICVMTIIAYSHGFNPSAFARKFGPCLQAFIEQGTREGPCDAP